MTSRVVPLKVAIFQTKHQLKLLFNFFLFKIFKGFKETVIKLSLTERNVLASNEDEYKKKNI
ncbi:hypothetical protein BpHYR1_027567 [Brachionus plicatilis]|uniref:Uncharacterized protein n=1 Tax=Brachionus plicatilis TaxID=10195 RepID=A0A3M7RQA4_BRAPC|nr:hypothetical protein BpHYR1_027567 [Brachionus plicatilis]